VRNFRFNQGCGNALEGGIAFGHGPCFGEETFDMVVPAMKVHDFNFTK